MLTVLYLLTFALGILMSDHLKRSWYELSEYLTNNLPATTMLPIATNEPSGGDSQWCIAGMYLVRDNGITTNRYLTRYARWLMGENADVAMLQPARHISPYVATTPTNGKYIRRKVERTYHAEIVSYPLKRSWYRNGSMVGHGNRNRFEVAA